MPIEVIPSGRVILVNPLQPSNVNMPIEVIPSGRFKLVNPLQNGMQLKLYPFSYIQITLPYCLYIKTYKVKCLVFEKITLFWATLCGYNLYSRLKAVTLRQTQQII